jgi:hypothetical protein
VLSVDIRSQHSGYWLPPFSHPATGAITDPVGSPTGWPSRFNAIHLAVIPNRSATGANPNDVVIAWDYDASNNGIGPSSAWPQRYTVGNPEVPSSFTNFRVNIPLGPVENGAPIFYGDLFCAGHCWLPDGRLFIAGGNAQYSPHYLGSRYVGIWDPAFARSAANNYGWTHIADATNAKPMRLARWYPTCTLISDQYVMVSGGVQTTAGIKSNDPAWDTYELFDFRPMVMDWVRDTPTSPPKLFDGPRGSVTPGSSTQMRMKLGEYPYMHFLSNNRVICCGPYRFSASVDPDPSLTASTGDVTVAPATNHWSHLLQWDTWFFRWNGSSVVVPNVDNNLALRDRVMLIGGAKGSVAHDDSTMLLAGNSPPAAGMPEPTWGFSQSIGTPRMVCNAVLMPNASIVLVGGSSNNYFSNPNLAVPVYRAATWDQSNGWQEDADGVEQVGKRMYHSTAALLPSGNLVSAGGDIRTDISYIPGSDVADWEVYVPRNLSNAQFQPQFSGAWALPGFRSLPFGSTHEIDFLAEGMELDPVSRVVLMRPCSTTHGVDMDQRYIQLETKFYEESYYEKVEITLPAAPVYTGTTQGSVKALHGWYMLFLVTASGVTSPAKWVELW